ncbi:hypothetical protein [Anaerotignum sp. MB30-C6]|uniref:hypothetical protein n=1 Tax=Anaerotignum sp. MB30-C6 TaxID=3070814 RepID=UPI0027DCF30D|nr:hypothetical protein [Anaerotignum sp. MB30-C6]WMI80666.1 hypothetical protein RBQ60_12670 [Anaerotignum sp. MB30-C6]
MKKRVSLGCNLVLFICILGVIFGIYCIVTTPISFPYLSVAFTWIMIWCIVAKYTLKKKKSMIHETQTNET